MSSILSFFLAILSRSSFDHHLRCVGWINFEFSKRENIRDGPKTIYKGNGSFRQRVVSALSRFGPGSFRPGSFRPWSIRPWGPGSFRPNSVGRFGLFFSAISLVTEGQLNTL